MRPSFASAHYASWRRVLFQIPRQQAEDVERRAVAFADRMSPVRIIHEVEGLAELDQLVDEPFCALEVDVVVARAVDESKRPWRPSAKVIGEPFL